jgi:hypothetical protein
MGFRTGGEPALSAMLEMEHTLPRNEIHATTSKNKRNRSTGLEACPVTIPGKKKRYDRDGESLTRAKQKSQTSLLIEYFEGGKSSQVDDDGVSGSRLHHSRNAGVGLQTNTFRSQNRNPLVSHPPRSALTCHRKI